MRDRMSEIFWHPVTAASRAPRFPTTWPRNDGLWGRECSGPVIKCFFSKLRCLLIHGWCAVFWRTPTEIFSYVWSKSKGYKTSLWMTKSLPKTRDNLRKISPMDQRSYCPIMTLGHHNNANKPITIHKVQAAFLFLKTSLQYAALVLLLPAAMRIHWVLSHVQPWPWNPEFLHFLLSSTLVRGVDVWKSLTKSG